MIITMVHEPYNLLGPALFGPLLDAMEAAASEGARAIVIRSGLRHFCAGADLTQFESRVGSDDKDPDDGATAGDRRDPSVALLDRFARVPLPVVCSVHGVCLGGGLELALACDFVIAARSAKFGSVEATLGLHPLLGGVQRLAQRAGEARAKEMAMLARRYDADTMERWNVINRVVGDDDLDDATAAVAAEFAAGPTIAHTATKRLIRVALDDGMTSAHEAMSEVQKPIWASHDLRTGLTSFQRRGPGLAEFAGV